MTDQFDFEAFNQAAIQGNPLTGEQGLFAPLRKHFLESALEGEMDSQRGVEDVLIPCVGGLSGFDTAIAQVFPAATVHRCMVHQLRNSSLHSQQTFQRICRRHQDRLPTPYRRVGLGTVGARRADLGKPLPARAVVEN